MPGISMERAKKRFSIRRGTHPQFGEMLMWDQVPPCRGVSCPAYAPCHYVTKDDEGSKCYTVATYLRTIVDRIYGAVGHQITEVQKLRIGLELIPLYRSLIRLKIEEIGLVSMTFETPRGDRKAQPLIKEIRETIKLVEQVLVGIGIHDIDIETNFEFDGRYNRDPCNPKAKILKAPQAAKSYYELLESSGGEKGSVDVLQLRRRKGAAT